ncbi:unnamed protein product [Nippostrongylus brasiliensis]|uniref:Uncharacterized protein n=1 Tax=Nippostrongylus brasiliensis TaxID=27835 RepID=A0A0N4XQY3_NIPBR|nr:unnamed protein product [Nippostrongylus brasiliensis]
MEVSVHRRSPARVTYPVHSKDTAAVSIQSVLAVPNSIWTNGPKCRRRVPEKVSRCVHRVSHVSNSLRRRISIAVLERKVKG